jgi:hypothetical protein
MSMGPLRRLAVASALLAGACSNKPYIAYEGTPYPPVGRFTASLASVPVGVAVAFRAQIQGGDQSGALTAALDDAARASLKTTTTAGQFLLVGLAPGKTTLRVSVDGTEASTVPVEVFNQTPTTTTNASFSQGLFGNPPPSCFGPSGGQVLRGPGCMSASDCFSGDVCCLDLSAGPEALCVPAGSPCYAQLCMTSRDCTAAQPCEAVGDSGLMACGRDGGL